MRDEREEHILDGREGEGWEGRVGEGWEGRVGGGGRELREDEKSRKRTRTGSSCNHLNMSLLPFR